MEVAQVYDKIGTELGVKVAPVGLAWQRSIEERPSLDLYDRDNSVFAVVTIGSRLT